jgi:hypothetical protein
MTSAILIISQEYLMKPIKNDDVELILKTPLQNIENKPLNLEGPKDLNYVDLALQQNEYQQNDYFKKQAANKGLGRPSNITEQINNIIEKGRDKDVEDRKGPINKRFNNPNISKTRKEYYK